jgi:tungstate transport system permease protein
MDIIITGLLEAFKLLAQGDPEVMEITLMTLKVSGLATVLSVMVGIPLGIFLALKKFTGRNFIVSLVNTGMGLPPTIAGLWVSILFWRYGLFGYFNIMYTPLAMLIAQFVIASPLVTAFTIAAIQNIDVKLRLQIKALGASTRQFYWLLIKEAKLPLVAAVIAGFGGVISEVGASMMVGGNIKGQTRVLTTATVMEVSKGNFDIALALGTILLFFAYGITFILTIIQQRGGQR